MSISKTGVLYFTDEEKARALANNNALEYALQKGYDLVKKGSYYTMREHDSMVFEQNGKWSWNSQSIIKGKALDFIQHYEEKSYIEAILELSGTVISPAIRKEIVANDKPKKLVIPPRSDKFDTVFTYLTKTRGISEDVIKKLYSEGKIYQSTQYQNLVMVGFNEYKQPKYISIRSTGINEENPFKMDSAGSDKSYPFIISGTDNTSTVCVLESPIEVMSYKSLCSITKSPNSGYDMISLGGTSTVSLDRYLSDHPHIKTIVVCTNNDKYHNINAGDKSMQAIQDKYRDNYTITTHSPHLNDWNDVLTSMRKTSIPTQEVRQEVANPMHKMGTTKKDRDISL